MRAKNILVSSDLSSLLLLQPAAFPNAHFISDLNEMSFRLQISAFTLFSLTARRPQHPFSWWRYSGMQMKAGWWNLQLRGALVCLFLSWIHDTSRITLLMVLETQPCGWRGVSCNSSCMEPPVSPSRVVFTGVTGLLADAWKLTFCSGVFKAICKATPDPSSPSLHAHLLLTAAPLSWCPVAGHSAGRDRLVNCRTKRRRRRRRMKFQPLLIWKWFNKKCFACIVCPLPGHRNSLHSQLFCANEAFSRPLTHLYKKNKIK